MTPRSFRDMPFGPLSSTGKENSSRIGGSRHTKDKRLLWGKLVGRRVDLSDRDSSVTARRELIEKLFMPEDE